jgi:hypothetical protein
MYSFHLSFHTLTSLPVTRQSMQPDAPGYKGLYNNNNKEIAKK